MPVAAEQEIIARITAMRQAGTPLRHIRAAIEQEHGRKLSLDALARVAKERQLEAA